MARSQGQAKVVPQYRQPRHFIWLFIAGLCVFRLWEVWPRQDWIRVALYSTLLFLPFAVIVHELAHAVAASLLETGVTRIKLGLTQNPVGPHLTVRFMGFSWEIYAIPLSGSVHHRYPESPDHFRTRCVLVTAAGPAASLALALPSLLCLWPGVPEPWCALLLAWSLGNFLMFVFTALPLHITQKGKPVLSDYALIRRHLAMTDQEVEQKCYLSRLQAEMEGENSVMGALSLDEAIARYEANPQRVGALMVLVNKLEERKDPRHSEYLSKLLDQPRLDQKGLAAYLDNHITRHLDDGTITGNPLFDRLSQKLMDLSGHSVTARGTRGSVLVELGRFEEGKAMLLDVLAKTDSDVDKAYSNIFLALADKHLGNLDAARRYATEASKMGSGCAALRRVADLLPVAERRS